MDCPDAQGTLKERCQRYVTAYLFDKAASRVLEYLLISKSYLEKDFILINYAWHTELA